MNSKVYPFFDTALVFQACCCQTSSYKTECTTNMYDSHCHWKSVNSQCVYAYYSHTVRIKSLQICPKKANIVSHHVAISTVF